MTVEKCLSACAQYQFAGLEYGGECWCGNTLATGTAKATAESQCGLTCSGNKTQICGDGNRLTLYTHQPVDLSASSSSKLFSSSTSNSAFSSSTLSSSTISALSSSSVTASTPSSVKSSVTPTTSANVQSSVSPAVSSSVQSSVNSAISSSVKSSVTSGASSSVKSSVTSATSSSVTSSVTSALSSSVFNSLTPSVSSSINSSAGSSISSSTKNSVVSSGSVNVQSSVTSVSSQPKTSVTSAPSSTLKTSVTSGASSFISTASSPSTFQTSVSKSASSSVSSSASVVRFEPTPGQTVGSYVYLGCANETSPRALVGVSKTDKTGTTTESCQQLCSQNNYGLAATENGDTCFCGNGLQSFSRLGKTFCNTSCAGNSSETCGGIDGSNNKYLSVWNSTSSAIPPTVVKQVGSYPLDNCYSDFNTTRALTGSTLTNATSMTVEACAEYCITKDYALAGLSYGKTCYCGSSLNVTAQVLPLAQCNMLCTGNRREFCGSYQTLLVYKKDSSSVDSNGVPKAINQPNVASITANTTSPA